MSFATRSGHVCRGMDFPETSKTKESELLEAARRGDGDAFRRLVEPFRGALHAHCYRLLGSSHDADDASQEALLRAWRALDRFVERGSLRSWLYTIATNVSLRLIERRPRRVLPIEYGPTGDEEHPLMESVWVEPYPAGPMLLDDETAAPHARYERRETLELAFIAALQHLPANQRAALILRDGLGFSAAEVARSLGTTAASVASALQRARRALDERVPDPTQQATLRAMGDKRIRRLVEDYIAAIEAGDVPRVLAMLAEDATWSMLAAAGDAVHGTTWYRGHGQLARFLSEGPLSGRWDWRHVATTANGQPAIAGYMREAEQESHRLRALDVLTLDGERIAEVTAVLDPEALSRFGLPAEI
jgi:RNA polymerase sigma-70 factor, ECF subfamily